MSIRKVRSVTQWRTMNAHGLVSHIKEIYRKKQPHDLASLSFWLDQSAEAAEKTFELSLKHSELEPICNPYGWTNEFQEVWSQALRWSLPVNARFEWIPCEDEWIFKGELYRAEKEHSIETGLYSKEQIRLLILELYDKDRQRFEKLNKLYSLTNGETTSDKRERIPERVRIEVWRRDGGKCAKCGSREKLEYDHIVPISRGGSNTARNIELLCQKCNREKHDNIG